MKAFLVPSTLALVSALAWGSEVEFATKPAAARAGGSTTITFALSAPTDVEVAILDAKGVVVRHLAAGALGGPQPPPAPLKPGLAQSIAWDGRDDYGEEVAGINAQRSTLNAQRSTVNAARDTRHAPPYAVRVRAGMGIKLDKIAGGDPYAYFSADMGQGDHAAWRIMGLEAKPDGTVYLLGNANNYGPPALRAYSAGGEYLRTVYPPPAGREVEDVRGWGVNIREDATYTPQYNDLSLPALSRTLICGTRGRIARLIPSPGNDGLLLEYGFRLMRINTDGTLAPSPMLDGLLINEPALPNKGRDLTGQMQLAMAPDRKSFYLGGLFAGRMERGRRTGAVTTGPWRDGQILKVDAATRKAAPFFALEEASLLGDLGARGKSPIGDTSTGPYAALQGVAADAEGRVFVADRQNRRVLIIDKGGGITREITVDNPDAIAVSPRSRTLFVTTRTGNYHAKGSLQLLRFADWSRDDQPSATIPLCSLGTYSQPTRLAVAQSSRGAFLWVAYTALPARVYRDTEMGLELVKDFYEAGGQMALDLQHMVVDPRTEVAYFADGWANCFRVADWKEPRFERCMQDANTPLRALSLAIDTCGRHLYGHADRKPVARYTLDGEFFAPVPVGASGHLVTPDFSNDWRIGLGFGDRGLAAAPCGGIVKLAVPGTGPDYPGPIYYFKPDAAKAPWEGLYFKQFGRSRSGGARFNPRGNLYVGRRDDAQTHKPPKGFEKDAFFTRSLGCIYKFAPTGSPAQGNLFPVEPAAPNKVYEINYGSIGNMFSRTPRFGVDGYGRIYYPTSLEPRVSVIDNEGNPLLSFGTYGNRDSLGGLPGDLVPTKGVPMAWPNSVDATDDFIYVSDIVNIRLLRLAKTFAAAETVAVK